MSEALYLEMVKIAADYLGPPADRFMSRHIRSHLNIEPNDINTDDIPKLEEWIKVSLGMVTSDHGMVDEFMTKLLSLRA